MSSRTQTPYYYKSPARRQDKEKASEKITKTPGNSKGRSKSPSAAGGLPKHGMSQSVLGYLKLMDELKGICTSIDETTVELKHLVDIFNQREAALTSEEQREEAKSIRETYGVPRSVEW